VPGFFRICWVPECAGISWLHVGYPCVSREFGYLDVSGHVGYLGVSREYGYLDVFGHAGYLGMFGHVTYLGVLGHVR
jgi:translation elongation factor EF-Tu-like GTPase